MITLEQLSDAVDSGKAYYLDLIADLRTKMKAGYDDHDTPECLGNLIMALEYDINSNNITDLTTDLYSRLQDLLGSYSGSYIIDPNIVIPGTMIVVAALNVMQTALVYPGDGVLSYTFPQLIGTEVLTVYRGTGTILRVHTTAADNEYAQLNPDTGKITVNYAFSALEGLWVEYKTT